MPKGIGGVIQLEVICTKPPPKLLSKAFFTERKNSKGT